MNIRIDDLTDATIRRISSCPGEIKFELLDITLSGKVIDAELNFFGVTQINIDGTSRLEINQLSDDGEIISAVKTNVGVELVVQWNWYRPRVSTTHSYEILCTGFNLIESQNA